MRGIVPRVVELFGNVLHIQCEKKFLVRTINSDQSVCIMHKSISEPPDPLQAYAKFWASRWTINYDSTDEEQYLLKVIC